MNNLYEYLVNNFKLNEPIILSDLKIDGMSYDNLRQQMKKLVDDGKVRRYENGVYYLPKPSKFNLDLGLNPETVLEYKYLTEDGEECGYMTGLMVFNQLGLTSQVPMVYEIAPQITTPMTKPKAQFFVVLGPDFLVGTFASDKEVTFSICIMS